MTSGRTPGSAAPADRIFRHVWIAAIYPDHGEGTGVQLDIATFGRGWLGARARGDARRPDRPARRDDPWFGGRGYFVAAAYRELVGARFVGIAIGHSLDFASRSNGLPFDPTEPDP